MRNIDLAPRAEGIRSTRTPATQFELSQIKAHFDESLQAVKRQSDVAERLSSDGNIADSKNIFRSQIVFAEGILDFYLHEMSKYALYRMFTGDWAPSERYHSLRVPMRQVEQAIVAGESKAWFFDFLNRQFERDVFLSVECMKDQLNLIGIPFKDVMVAAFPKRTEQESVEAGKEIIHNLFDRRNAIAHQNDRCHESAEQNDISSEFVEEKLSELEALVAAIHEIAAGNG